MKMRKCPICKSYTFKEICPNCNKKTIVPLPPSFSLRKYKRYRKLIKK